jgi:hypothetical protein
MNELTVSTKEKICGVMLAGQCIRFAAEAVELFYAPHADRENVVFLVFFKKEIWKTQRAVIPNSKCMT